MRRRRSLPVLAGCVIAGGIGAVGVAGAEEPSPFRSITMSDPEGAHGQCGANFKCVGPFARDKDGTTGLPQVLPLTVSAWFKAPADGLARPIAQHGANTTNIDGVVVTPRGWTLERRGDQMIGFALQSGNPGWYKMFSLVTPPDQWVFVAVVVDATGGMTLHTWDSLNGWRGEIPTGKVLPYVPAAPSGQEGFLSVGASKGAPNREFTGRIDDVRVWAVTRTAAEIQADFQTTLTGTEPGLAGYWSLEGDTATSTSVPDLSPNSNDMKLDGPNGDFFFESLGSRSSETPMQVPEAAGAPAVVGLTPADGATGVPLAGPFTVSFSEPMEAVTVARGVTLAPAAGGAPVAVTATPASATAFTLAPVAPLVTGTAYRLTVGAGAKDFAGTGATPAERTFTTLGPAPPTTQTTPTAPTGPSTTTPQTRAPQTRRGVARPAHCRKYPRLRATLARQLKAAKRARLAAESPRARARAAKRVRTIQLQQKRATARFKAACRARAAAR